MPSKEFNSAAVAVTPSNMLSSAAVDVTAVEPIVIAEVVKPAMTKLAAAYPVALVFTVVLGTVCVSVNNLNVLSVEAS